MFDIKIHREVEDAFDDFTLTFTDSMIDGYIELKREEVQKLDMSTHPVEFEMYYSV